MTSTSLITNAAAFFSLFAAVACAAERNYSLWPRRPAELEQARRLIRSGQEDEALSLLAPYVGESGIAGREARQITSAVNTRRYLTRQHPKAQVVTVKRGDTLASIAGACHCPADVIMMLNGIVQPSSLKIGQKLVVVPMDLRVEIHPAQREVSVWDGATLVADYNLTEISAPAKQENEETVVSARNGYLGDNRIPARSPHFSSSDKTLSLENGQTLYSSQRVEGAGYRMETKDLNELAMLVAAGARVSIVWDAETYTPSAGRPQQ